MESAPGRECVDLRGGGGGGDGGGWQGDENMWGPLC